MEGSVSDVVERQFGELQMMTDGEDDEMLSDSPRDEPIPGNGLYSITLLFIKVVHLFPPAT